MVSFPFSGDVTACPNDAFDWMDPGQDTDQPVL